MRVSSFFRLGKFIYRFRVAVILVWVILVLGCAPFITDLVTPFKSTGFVDNNSESAKTTKYLNKKLGYNDNQFIVLYTSKSLLATDPTYISKVKNSLSELKHFPLKHEIIFPDANKKQISEDKHTAYAVILFKDNTPMSDKLLNQFVADIKPPTHMTMQLGGEAIFVESLNKQTQKDLAKADMIATPVSIITLIFVFGTIVAALIPIVLGGGCALIILTALYFMGLLFTLSIFTLNIAVLLGLCLSLDYSLFVINRFREELRTNYNVPHAIATTLATAGKAVFFSGLAVFISLSALLLFPINILFSVAVGGLAAVFIAVAIAVTLLPAILAVLKHRINFLSVGFIMNREHDPNVKLKAWHFWHRLATTVVKRPSIFFVVTLVLLLLLGYPFLNARFGISDFHILPDHSTGRVFFDTFRKSFNQNELTPIQVVVSTDKGKILSETNLSKLYDFTTHLKHNPLIDQVNSIVTTEPRLTKSQYAAFYNAPEQFNDDVRQLLKTTTTKHLTVISVVSKNDVNSSKTKKLIEQLRQMNPGKGLTMHLTGVPVNNVEVLKSISTIIPYAMIWITVLTYLILLVLFRSLFLPFKAILMNILSLSASYGVLVFIFQEGHLHHLLNFNPQGMLDISLVVIIFCALFGFSMDYEVFLLTRIQEFYKMTKDNKKSIVFGITRSSKIITSAAIIVIFICGSFMVADDLMVKEFGLGIAVAIFVDAFIIRTLLVPATMVLMREWTWYIPMWLDKRLPNSHQKR